MGYVGYVQKKTKSATNKLFAIRVAVSVQHSPEKRCKNLWIMGTIGAAMFLSACQPNLDYHGHSVVRQEINELKVGCTTKDQVLASLGKPSVVLSYDPQTFYYLSQVVSNRSLLKPESVKVNCIGLTFSSSGILSKIEYSLQPYPVRMTNASIALPSKHSERFLQKLLGSFDESLSNVTINPL